MHMSFPFICMLIGGISLIVHCKSHFAGAEALHFQIVLQQLLRFQLNEKKKKKTNQVNKNWYETAQVPPSGWTDCCRYINIAVVRARRHFIHAKRTCVCLWWCHLLPHCVGIAKTWETNRDDVTAFAAYSVACVGAGAFAHSRTHAGNQFTCWLE